MLGAGVLLKFVEADGAACVHILNALANAVEHAGFFGNLAKLLVGGGALDDAALPLMVRMTGSPVCFRVAQQIRMCFS